MKSLHYLLKSAIDWACDNFANLQCTQIDLFPLGVDNMGVPQEPRLFWGHHSVLCEGEPRAGTLQGGVLWGQTRARTRQETVAVWEGSPAQVSSRDCQR